MDLCTAKAILNPPVSNPGIFTPNHTQSTLRLKTHFPLSLKQISICLSNPGVQYSVRSTTSEETSSETTPNDKDKTGFQFNEAPQEDSLMYNPMQLFQFLEKINVEDNYGNHITVADGYWSNTFHFSCDEMCWANTHLPHQQIDYEEAYYFLVFGGGGVVLYWIAAAIVKAIDSIPVFPQMLELVGLAYTLWFTTRFLIFKKNRDELVSKVEEIKEEILGSRDN